MPILPAMAEMGMRHWLTRGKRKQEAELAEREMSLREKQESRLQRVETREAKMQPFLQKQIDAQIESWQSQNQNRITAEDNSMFRSMLTASTAAAERGDFDAANSITRMMKLNFPQYSGVGEVVYEPGQKQGEFKVSNLGDGKALMWDETGKYNVIDVNDDDTPMAANFKNLLDLTKELRANMDRIDKKYESQGGIMEAIDFEKDMAEEGGEPGAAEQDFLRYQGYQQLYNDTMNQLFGGAEGAAPPQIKKPPKTQEVVEIAMADLPDEIRKQPKGTRVVLKDGRVLEITEKGARVLSKEEVEAWRTQKAR